MRIKFEILFEITVVIILICMILWMSGLFGLKLNLSIFNINTQQKIQDTINIMNIEKHRTRVLTSHKLNDRSYIFNNF